MRWTVHVACIQYFLVGKPEGKRSLERHRRRWEDYIRIYLGNKVGRCGLYASGSG
jgi:hypothetical protein